MMPGFYYDARNNAISKVSVAMYAGELARLSEENIPCVDCGKRAVHYDHRDYAKPLEVQPVCSSCNCKRGHGLINGEIVPACKSRRWNEKKAA